MRFVIFAFLLVSLNASAQWKDYIISVRGDTLNRVDMNGKKQGPWVIHVDELRGEPGYDEQGYFENDMKVDVWVKFSTVGDKLAEENYRWGKLHGRSKYYTRLGGLVREENWRAVEPGKQYDTVDVYDINDPTKIIDKAIIKVEGKSFKHGTWNYYDPEWGTVQKTEHWFMDKAQNADGSLKTDDDEVKPLEISKDKKTVQKPQAILDYEKKNSGKKKIKTRDGSTGQ